MIEHDIICPLYQTGIPRHRPNCRCFIIALARDNERERIAQAIEAERDRDPETGDFEEGSEKNAVLSWAARRARQIGGAQ